MATTGIQNLSGQFVNLATALNVGLVPQGNGSWLIPSATPPVNQGVLSGGPVLLATPTFAPRGILVQMPRTYTQIDAIATAIQANLNEGTGMARDLEPTDKAMMAVDSFYGKARGFFDKEMTDIPVEVFDDPDEMKRRAELALFDCLKGVGICLAFKGNDLFGPPLIKAGIDLATALQEKHLNPQSPTVALLAELQMEVMSMQPPRKGSGEELEAEYRQNAMLKAGLAWQSYVLYLTRADDTPADLFEDAVYRGAHHLYAAGAYGELANAYQLAGNYYSLRDDNERSGRYALRAAWANSNRPEEAHEQAMRLIDHIYFNRFLPNLAALYPMGMDRPAIQNVDGIISGLSSQLRPPSGGGDVPHDCKPLK